MLRKLLVIGILTVLLFSPLLMVSNVKADPPSSPVFSWKVGDGQRGMDFDLVGSDNFYEGTGLFTTVVINSTATCDSPSGQINIELCTDYGNQGIFIDLLFGQDKILYSGDFIVSNSYGDSQAFEWSDPSNKTLSIEIVGLGYNHVADANIYMNDVKILTILDLTYGPFSIFADNYYFPFRGEGKVTAQISEVTTYSMWSHLTTPLTGSKIVFNLSDLQQISDPENPSSPSNAYTVKSLLSSFAPNGTVAVNMNAFVHGGGGDNSLIFSDFSTSGNLTAEQLYQHNFLEIRFSGGEEGMSFWEHLAGHLDLTQLSMPEYAYVTPQFKFTITNTTLYVYNDEHYENGLINEGGSLFTAFAGSQIRSVWVTNFYDLPQTGFMDFTFFGRTVSAGGGGAVPTPAPTFQPTQQPSSRPNSQQPTTSNWWLLVPFVGVGAGAVGVTILLKAKGKPRRRKH
jgi:hypothetical protein